MKVMFVCQAFGWPTLVGSKHRKRENGRFVTAWRDVFWENLLEIYAESLKSFVYRDLDLMVSFWVYLFKSRESPAFEL